MEYFRLPTGKKRVALDNSNFHLAISSDTYHPKWYQQTHIEFIRRGGIEVQSSQSQLRAKKRVASRYTIFGKEDFNTMLKR
ncbi:predicted protein [Sclerotinia sclerotiorum 1980 UF-70]|uniref:Uncharacterized protein n=1 Tax=Sclerotinia sclerotiorum (strain ATCC 18683 / 1980 / Ss-1) TaxID=665079 RepID=A7EI62_SCLS1|nr:predicted protein [Sclerotinia sclerotiorum 1980 UF-70]EDO02528.1 predicted protein [Sclerotinia sclerotiorum 1980 UF-70]